MSRTLFMGTPEFALPSLAALANGSQLVGVVAQSDKPQGRGQAVQPPPVARWAKEQGVLLLQPERARDAGFVLRLEQLELDLIVVAAYGKILPLAVLQVPRLGCVNVHASLLPKYRGAAPIQWAVANGELETGVTLMQMDQGLDTGPMLAQRAIPIDSSDTGGSLTVKVAALGGQLLAEQLPLLLAGALPTVPQDSSAATLAPKLTRDDAWLELALSARQLYDRVRAFQPWPGGLLQLPSMTLKVLRTEVVTSETRSAPPGTVLAADHDGLLVATGDGALRLIEVQPEARRRMSASDFLAGHPIAVGSRLGSP